MRETISSDRCGLAWLHRGVDDSRRHLEPQNQLTLGQLSIGASFATASAVSVFLVVSYARLFVGWTFALREIGIAQLLYLVLFSYTFFWDGFTGLAITIGAIATLFFVMQATGRTDWSLASQQRRAMPAP